MNPLELTLAALCLGACTPPLRERPARADARETAKPMATATAQEPNPPMEAEPAVTGARLQQVEAITTEHRQAMEAWNREYLQLTTEADRDAFIEQKPQPKAADFARRLWPIVEQDPQDAASRTALVWIVQRDHGREHEKAVTALERDHAQAPGLEGVATWLQYDQSDVAERFLEKLAEDHPARSVRAIAAWSIAMREKGALGGASESRLAEFRHALDRIAADYGDVTLDGNVPLRDLVQREIFELDHTSIGKVAPEITGEDIGGKPMKLSDFRGKVVLLDFWGHW